MVGGGGFSEGGGGDCRCGRGSKHAECQPRKGKEKREKKKKKEPGMRRVGVSVELARDCNYTTCRVSSPLAKFAGKRPGVIAAAGHAL